MVKKKGKSKRISLKDKYKIQRRVVGEFVLGNACVVSCKEEDLQVAE